MMQETLSKLMSIVEFLERKARHRVSRMESALKKSWIQQLDAIRCVRAIDGLKRT